MSTEQEPSSRPNAPVSFVPTQPAEPMRMINLNKGLAKLVGRIPPHLSKFPSMMSVQEKRLLYGLASEYYSGAGLLIDAGIFLGASTRCFGEGIRANNRLSKPFSRFPECKPIISFERGIVNPGMPDFFERNKVAIDAVVGDTFAPWLIEIIKPVRDLVDLRIGDIVETMEDISAPVEILFLDVLKLPEISKAVLAKFFPLLIPGRSIVVQQDYLYERLEFIKTDQEFFAEYFMFVGEVGSSAIFLCTKQIDAAAMIAFNQPLAAHTQEKLAAIAMQRSIDPSRRFLMAISMVRLLYKLYGEDAANQYLAIVRRDYPEQANSHLPRLREAMQTLETHLKKGKRKKVL